jgi:hypothetical protein
MKPGISSTVMQHVREMKIEKRKKKKKKTWGTFCHVGIRGIGRFRQVHQVQQQQPKPRLALALSAIAIFK